MLGASGCVGSTLLRRLRSRDDLHLILAARDAGRLEDEVAGSDGNAESRTVDLDRPGSFGAALTDDIDLVINCSGRYRDHGMQVARAAAERGISLLDIADEPIYLDEVVKLSATAVERGCGLIIGSGSAPQTTGALLRLASGALRPPLDVKVAACFGFNRIGPNAVRTATEAVGGWISIGSPGNVWKPGPALDFPHPFGAMRARCYPLPETMFLPQMEGVQTWFAGACLSSPWMNRLVAVLKALYLARRARKWMFLGAWCRFAAFVESTCAQRGIGKPGIAFVVEAADREQTVCCRLYHPDMTTLTAEALRLTLDQWLTESPRRAGVFLAQDYIDPKPFLEALRSAGAVWSIGGLPNAR